MPWGLPLSVAIHSTSAPRCFFKRSSFSCFTTPPSSTSGRSAQSASSFGSSGQAAPSSSSGVATAARVTRHLAKTRFGQDVTSDEIKATLAEEITRILGGELKVESKVGKGSTFTLYLPLNFSPAQTGASRQQQTGGAALARTMRVGVAPTLRAD